jgi:hypothetical protein
MDLNQRKLTKSEWTSIEIPINDNEKEILSLITNGFNNVNIKYNKHKSLFGYLKIDYNETMEDYLYNNYFSGKINDINAKYNMNSIFNIYVKANPIIKKADLIRISKNCNDNIKKYDIFELLLIKLLDELLNYKNKKSSGSKWLNYYFTLYKLIRINVTQINRHITKIVENAITHFENEVNMFNIISGSVDFIEKNDLMLKYSDYTLYEHQKQLFTFVKNKGPKLVLYIAPTGTGKTLSPIGLSEGFKIIFVCAARHIGLALAKAAISVNKKIAFAFGCSSADDIRLHYFSAKEFSKNKKTGGIGKVDNSIGDKVEIMICDIKSYLPAMYYMKSFNPVENIIVYWDEPTITMDYENHELHSIIHDNWKNNLIPNMVLSSATLPKMEELLDTINDFKNKFSDAEIYNIVSYDCKKTIPILNKYGYVVLPHTLSEDYDEVMKVVEHCEKNLTLLRYFDLNEVVEFIKFVENNNLIQQSATISKRFHCITDVNMMNIKLHYLFVLKKILKGSWGSIYISMKINNKRKIQLNNFVDPKGNKMKKNNSIGPGICENSSTSIHDGKEISRLYSEQIVKNDSNEQAGIYITTKDSFTLTDGPTIFLAEDVEKIAKFCIQQSSIPVKVMDDILEKIEFNNKINSKIDILEKELVEINDKYIISDDNCDNSKKGDTKTKKLTTEDNRKTDQINNELDRYRSMINPAQLNETFIPNKTLHLKKWVDSSIEVGNSFTSDIDEKTIIEIMLLKDIDSSWKILLLMGIGVFTNHPSIEYTEIMKKLAEQQKLYIIIASSDYIYGTNYQFCHGYLSKDLNLTQEKIIQALGRIGRNNIQQNYSIRFRDDEQIKKLFYPELDKQEVRNMNILFNS